MPSGSLVTWGSSLSVQILNLQTRFNLEGCHGELQTLKPKPYHPSLSGAQECSEKRLILQFPTNSCPPCLEGQEDLVTRQKMEATRATVISRVINLLTKIPVTIQVFSRSKGTGVAGAYPTQGTVSFILAVLLSGLTML